MSIKQWNTATQTAEDVVPCQIIEKHNDIDDTTPSEDKVYSSIKVESRINDVNLDLTASDNLKFKFATDGEGNYGYLKADGSFVPFKSGSTDDGATIACTTDEESLIGTTATLSLNSEVVGSTVINSDGTFSFGNITTVGDYILTVTDGTKTTPYYVEVTADHILNSTVIVLSIALLKIVTWADGTDEEIAAMLNAYYEGELDISDYWSVGDTRSIELSAMAGDDSIDEVAAGNANTMKASEAQTIEFVIIGIEHDDLATPINGKTKSAITIHMKNCFDSNYAPINLSKEGVENSKYSISLRKSWIDNAFEAALPSWLKTAVKSVQKITREGNETTGSSLVSSTEKCFLLSCFEVFGQVATTSPLDGDQYEYYKTVSNRLKKKESSIVTWLTRSTSFSNPNCWMSEVTSQGTLNIQYANYPRGIAVGMAL